MKKKRQAYNQQHDATLERLREKEPEIYAAVIQLLDEYLEENRMEVPEKFCEGFSIGVWMMVEVFMRA